MKKLLCLLTLSALATTSVVVTYAGDTNLISVDFVTPRTGSAAPASGDTSPTSTTVPNADGLIFTGQDGAWNAFNIDPGNKGNFTDNPVGPSAYLTNGAGGVTTVTFAITSKYRCSTGTTTLVGYLRNESARLYPSLGTANPVTWQITGLAPNAPYQLAFFMSTADGTNTANGIDGVRDSEGDANWTNVVADGTGTISGALGGTSSANLPMYGFQLERLYNNQPPQVAPSAPSPTNGATNVAVSTALGWAVCPGAESYDVYLWFTPGTPPGQPTATVTVNQYVPPGNLLPSTNYSWQVVARNSAGSTNGPVWTFATQPPQPPSTPMTPTPADGATGVAISTSLDWADSTNANGYAVYLWLASGSKPGTPTAKVVASQWTPPSNLLYGSNYNWQVVATNVYASTTGAVWGFQTSANTAQVTNLISGTTLRYPLVLVSGVYDGQSLQVTAVPTNASVSLTTYGTRFRCLVDLQPGTNTLMIADNHGPVPFSLVYTPATATSYRYKMWYVVPSDEAATPVDTNYYTHYNLQAKLMQSWEAEDQLRGGHGRTTFYPEMDASNNVNVGYLVLTQTRAQAEALGDGIFNAVYNQLPSPYNNGFYKNVVFSSVNPHALESGIMAYVGAYTNVHPNNVAGIMGALLSTAVGNDGVLTYATYTGVTLHEIGHTINDIWHDLNYPSIMSGTDYDISEYFTLTHSVANPTPHNECCAGTMGNQRDLVAWGRFLMNPDPYTYGNTTVSLTTGPEYLTASSAYPLAVFYYYIPDSTVDLHTNLWSSGITTFRKHLGRALQEVGSFPFNIMAVDTQGNLTYTTFSGGTIPVVPVNDSYAVSGTTVIAAPGVLGNDYNPSTNTLTAVLATNVQHGTLSLSANGGFTYTPGLGFTGTDTFWYTAVDAISSDQQARVTLTGPLMPPALPATPAPADSATGVAVSTVLDWGDSSGATGYRVYLWLSSQAKPATPTASVAASTFDPPGSLLAGTNYSWQVVATNTAGSSTGAVWTFTTQLPQPPLFPVSGFSRPGGVPTFDIPNTVSLSQYTLTYKNHLTDPAWTPLGGSGTAPGNGGTLRLSDPTVVGSLPGARFYRLQRNP